ncbi:MAG: DUF2520 domain-containing protein [Bdellovibrionota bacterium]
MGRAFAAYLDARQLPYRVITRDSLISEITASDVRFTAVLLAISDGSLNTVATLLSDCCVPLVYFSGSAQVPNALAFHPLYSFTNRSISLEDFEKIPFICDPGNGNKFTEIFAGFSNPVFEMDRARDARYHALCVMLGNLPLLIQDRAARTLERDFGLPREACLPFLDSLLKNFSVATSQTSLVAGPVARKDAATTALHLSALEGDSFLGALYRLLVEDAWPEYPLVRNL